MQHPVRSMPSGLVLGLVLVLGLGLGRAASCEVDAE